MEPLNRRDALQRAAGAGLVLGTSGLAPEAQAAQDEPAPNSDRQFVINAGLNEAEADCWETAAKLAGQFFALEQLHPLDRPEVVTAIHVIQNKLLGRPTYRRYLEQARPRPAQGENS